MGKLLLLTLYLIYVCGGTAPLIPTRCWELALEPFMLNALLNVARTLAREKNAVKHYFSVVS